MGAEASKISVVLWEKIEPSKAMGKFGDMLAEGEYVEHISPKEIDLYSQTKEF